MTLGLLSASLLALLSVAHFGPHNQGQPPISSERKSDGSPHAGPTDATVRDRPNDGGGALVVSWQPAAGLEFTGYEVWRQAESDTWVRAGFRGPRAVVFEDNEVTDRRRYRYRVAAITEAGPVFSEPSAWAQSSARWFDFEQLPAMVGTVFFTILIVWFIEHARRNRSLFIRRIADLPVRDIF